jgi:predicted DNA-binding transcriptional regulator AlpA
MARKKTSKRVSVPSGSKVAPQTPLKRVETPVTKSPPERVEMPPSLLITQADLCALLKISRSTLARMEKQIPSPVPGRVIIGGSVRYHRHVIESWIMELAKVV